MQQKGQAADNLIKFMQDIGILTGLHSNGRISKRILDPDNTV